MVRKSLGAAALVLQCTAAFTVLPQQQPSAAGWAHARTQVEAYRQDIRMPSTEPQVPYKPPGSDQATWVGVNQRLQRSRILMVGKFIDDEYANQLIAMMLYLEKESRDKPVSLYFNSPGANLRPAMAVFDTMQQMAFPTSTLNLGLATGMVSFLCAAGDKGKRFALPNARFLMQRTGMEDAYRGQASDIGIEVGQMVKKNNRMEEALTAITGHTRDKIRADFQRDFYLSAAEAVQYGVIDKVLMPRDKTRKMESTKDLQFGDNAFTRSQDPTFGEFGGEDQRYGGQKGGGWGRTPDSDGPGTAV
ncbi:Clp protease-domain-containing protein [Tribonema minus]|uniref:ATP-dependent Clp protease proteolytic subunit n=1 Tax=Tribonema minus TaxID=303371 RepID=A0A835YH32_9STRA|nr:Clp protease-domain-containing protein [Tribonema minus]